MSEAVHIDRELAFIQEATYGQDPVGNMFYLGKYNVPIGDIPIHKTQIVPIYNGSREAETILQQSKTIPIEHLSTVVNAIPLYWFLGKAVDNAGIVTISKADLGTDRPSLTIRSKTASGDGIDKIQEHLSGQRLYSLQFNIDLTNPAPITYAMGFDGIGYTVNTTTPTITFPSSQVDEYKYDSNFELNWDSDGDNHALSGLLMFNLNMSINRNPNKLRSSLFPSDFYEKENIYTITATFMRGATNVIELYNDYKAQDHSDQSTYKNMMLKMFLDSTKYIQLDIDGVAWGEPVPTDIEIYDRKVPAITYTGIFKSIEPKTNDGVANSFYDIV